MDYWDIPWWQRQSLHAWHFWVHPHGEVRTTDPRMKPQAYYYTFPPPTHRPVLTEAGWVPCGNNPPMYRTDDVSVAQESLATLGLRLPVWGQEYSYRVDWFEPSFCI